jgi:hypothetical protein
MIGSVNDHNVLVLDDQVLVGKRMITDISCSQFRVSE